MADNIRRDAATYNQKCANYRAAAQRREDTRRDELARYVRQLENNRERPRRAAP